MLFCVVSSRSKPDMNDLIAVVFAVPGPPTNSACLSTLVTNPRRASRRTESSVGMIKRANLGVSSSRGYSQFGTLSFQCFHSVSSSETKYSKNVSLESSSNAGWFPSLSATSARFSFGRSLKFNIPPSDHVRLYKNRRS
eukprot:31437-Pelagococcus_subviridis.AAC.2